MNNLFHIVNHFDAPNEEHIFTNKTIHFIGTPIRGWIQQYPEQVLYILDAGSKVEEIREDMIISVGYPVKANMG